MSDGRYETADTMAERVDATYRIRFLFVANRQLVTATLAAAVFVVFVLVGAFAHPRFADVLATESTIEILFSAMLGAIITGVTLVVTIGQIIISQENGPLGDQHRRMSDAMNVREYVAEVIGRPAPPTPSALLRALVETIRDRARELQAVVDDAEGTDLAADVEQLTDSLVENADRTEAQLADAEFGTFGVVSAALDFNYSADVYFVEELRHRHDDRLTDDQEARLTELKTALTMFGPAREHVKTLYFEWELANLSKYIVYLAIPATVVAVVSLSFLDGGTFTGQSAGVPDIVWVVGLAVTISVTPFLLLAAYVLRIVVVAKHTLAIGPLVLRKLDV